MTRADQSHISLQAEWAQQFVRSRIKEEKIDLDSPAEIGTDSTVLYAHLGGQLALNAYSGLL